MIFDPIILGFSIVLLVVSYGLFRTTLYPRKQQLKKISVVVAARNEKHNISDLFCCFQNFDYPENLLELIVVDDASTDGTFELMQELAPTVKNLKILRLTEKDLQYRGKKAALKLGIENSSGEIIMLTDADSLPPKNWIKSFVSYFTNDNIGMVAGYAPEVTDSKFNYFIRQLNLSLMASVIGLGLPHSCSGCNMAFTRKAYNTVGGYESFKNSLAGDDKMMMKAIFTAGYKILYNPHIKLFTKPYKSNFIDQQKRRYGKMKMSFWYFQVISLAAIFVYSYITLKLIFDFNYLDLIVFLAGISVYWISSSSILKEKIRINQFLYLLAYPYYAIFFTIWGQCSKWNWK